MKLLIEIKQLPGGNIDFKVNAVEQPLTRREESYGKAIVELLRREVPTIGDTLGASAAIHFDASKKPETQ